MIDMHHETIPIEGVWSISVGTQQGAITKPGERSCVHMAWIGAKPGQSPECAALAPESTAMGTAFLDEHGRMREVEEIAATIPERPTNKEGASGWGWGGHEVPNTIVASSKFVDVSPAQMWKESEQAYILAHPSWFEIWNAEQPHGHPGFKQICNLDLPENRDQREHVFDALSRWKADTHKSKFNDCKRNGGRDFRADPSDQCYVDG